MWSTGFTRLIAVDAVSLVIVGAHPVYRKSQGWKPFVSAVATTYQMVNYVSAALRILLHFFKCERGQHLKALFEKPFIS